VHVKSVDEEKLILPVAVFRIILLNKMEASSPFDPLQIVQLKQYLLEIFTFSVIEKSGLQGSL
jgi:hypothetical protein